MVALADLHGYKTKIIFQRLLLRLSGLGKNIELDWWSIP